MILYHCSPTLIEENKFYANLHVGGLYSSLQAGLRKLRTHTNKILYLKKLYLILIMI